MALNTNALITLAAAKGWLKIPTLETSQDSLLELLINATSDYVESDTGRKIKSSQITEYQHGRRNNIILTEEYPILSVDSLKIDQTANYSGDEDILTSDEYAIADSGSSIVLKDRVFPNGYNNIKIVYTAGYTTIPSDLQLATLLIVSYHYRIRQDDDFSRTTKGKGDESVNIALEIPKEAQKIISFYRRMECAIANAQVRNG